MSNLEQLTLTFDAPPGIITGLPRLQQHHGVRTLHLDDAYGLDPDALPELPQLRQLVLNGTRRTTATTLRQRFRRSSVELSANGAKSEAWLAAIANRRGTPSKDLAGRIHVPEARATEWFDEVRRF